MMKLIFTVKSTIQVNDGKMLVQLSGKHGNVALDLPLGHAITVGQEFVLEADVVSLVEINQVAQRGLLKAIAGPLPPNMPYGLTPPPKL
jgi:hypothetical protein